MTERAQKEETLPISESWHDAGPPSQACLILVGQSYRPEKPISRIINLNGLTRLTLGRGDEDGFQREGSILRCTLADRWLSGDHAELRIFPSGGETWCVLLDLGSTNGCRVNGQPTARRQLRHGDTIETGQTYWLYYQRPVEDFSTLLEQAYDGGDIASTSSVSLAMLGQCLQMRRIAGTEIPVIVQGESGTGKELMTAALHRSSRRPGACVALNCAAIPATLMESELFGHCRGAFTGATRSKRGLAEEAHQGTLFLDEVGDMPLDLQAKLLRLLQERSFVRVGDTATRTVDVRFIAATNRDLEKMVQEGTFRGDLFARLNGICLELPPLRQRKEDIGLLLATFLGRCEAEMELSLEAYRALLAHDWPYNIRELEKAIATAAALAEGRTRIKLADLPAGLRKRAPGGEPGEPAPEHSEEPLGRRFSDEELRRRLVEALTAHQGNVAAVAQELSTSRSQVHRWMKRVSLGPDMFRNSPSLD